MADEVVLLVDVANVMGSRPDGWWRDRLGAATRLLGELASLTDLSVQGEKVSVGRILAVVEGKAKGATGPDPVEVIRASADGDSTIVVVAEQIVAEGGIPLVATADRGLRARLPEAALVMGPATLREALS
ncbi:hypothetical protein [Kineosporia sp. NBRC 101731]|uniref:hypothetical protein n=1 Tax=Kineosporia sp. NBRC 101731 TaxID=3032199 RepID=UPI0024A4C2E7|nr:hypothetical protein [Kineosporia sp. NBRC 101731]GLY26743.1 hypothetical protein Kisp02_01080 [Kineosporia sp. NBRC 101731]